MSTANDLYDDFDDVLEQAECNAKTDWEMEFVENLKAKYRDYGKLMFLSDKQKEILDRICR